MAFIQSIYIRFFYIVQSGAWPLSAAFSIAPDSRSPLQRDGGWKDARLESSNLHLAERDRHLLGGAAGAAVD